MEDRPGNSVVKIYCTLIVLFFNVSLSLTVNVFTHIISTDGIPPDKFSWWYSSKWILLIVYYQYTDSILCLRPSSITSICLHHDHPLLTRIFQARTMFSSALSLLITLLKSSVYLFFIVVYKILFSSDSSRRSLLVSATFAWYSQHPDEKLHLRCLLIFLICPFTFQNMRLYSNSGSV